MSESTQSLGEQLTTLLEHYGVTTVFGIPGVHTIELYRGLKNSSIHHITPRHEQGAGFMADGYARATGNVGVCLCITGPGMTNIATPMGQAYADSIPMLVISSVNRTNSLGQGQGRLHELKNQSELIAGVSAFSHTILSADDLPSAFARAFAVFKAARPRPVHIEIPTDLMTQPTSYALPNLTPMPAKPGPDPSIVTQIVDGLAKSKRTAILVGGGCIDAQKPLHRFVNLTGAPTCLTINARGLLPPDHPLLLDGVQTVNEFRDYIASCDMCIAIGTELGETDYDFYDVGPLVPGGELVRIDIDPQQMSTNGIASIPLVSDATLALEALSDAIEQRANEKQPTPKPQQDATTTVLQINSALKAQFTEPTKQYDALLQAIALACPNAIIVGDSTKPIYHANFCHRATAPRRWFNSATGFGTLGYALPAAIGAKLGKPELPVIAIAGDGGFQFTLNELVVASQNKLAIAIIVWNNNGYKEISDFMQRNEISPVGVDVQGPNLKHLASAMHAQYAAASEIADIEKHLSTLANLASPLLIEYLTDTDA